MRLAREGATVVINSRTQARVDAAAMEHEFFASARPSSLLKRFITPDEVANLIVYTASPFATATNGAAGRWQRGARGAVAIHHRRWQPGPVNALADHALMQGRPRFRHHARS